MPVRDSYQGQLRVDMLAAFQECRQQVGYLRRLPRVGHRDAAMSIDDTAEPGMTESRPRDTDAIDNRAEAVDQLQSPERDTGDGKRQPAETRTREEYADDVRSGRGSATHDPDSTLGGSMAETAPGATLGGRVRATEREQAEPLTRGDYASKMRQHDPGAAGAAEKMAENLLPGTGTGQPRDLTVMAGLHPVQIRAADTVERTIGDTTPVGIGRKPTGEELIDLSGGSRSISRVDRFLDKAIEDIGDLRDGLGSLADAVASDLHPDPGPPAVPAPRERYTLQQEAHPAIQQRAPPDASTPGDIVGSLAVTAVAAARSIRYLLHRWKGHNRD
jgi:hypothetical protein